MLEKECDAGDVDTLREKNLKERNAFLSSVITDPTFADAVTGINVVNKAKDQTVKRTAKKRNGDSTFRFAGVIPSERRNSARLKNKIPDYSYLDLPDEKQIAAAHENLEGLEDIVYRKKTTRRSSPRTILSAILPVEAVTETMLKNIQTSGNKVYGPGGTSCHQCRQRTVDTKTNCRSGYCVGMRGQLCGICVVNRYGEDPAQALKDPNWKCYVCRGCCNCSFCRRKQGKRPTGILTPLAKQNGYKSVLDFLVSLNGHGDYAEPEKDPENLLGFHGDVAVMGNNKKINLKCETDHFRHTWSAAMTKKIAKLVKDPENLLGFRGDVAVMGGNKTITLKCDSDHKNLTKIYGEFARLAEDSENLLGFQGDVAVLGGNKTINLKCDTDHFNRNLIKKYELELEFAQLAKRPENLLGFRGDIAVMGGKKTVSFSCDLDYIFGDWKNAEQAMGGPVDASVVLNGCAKVAEDV